MRPTRDDYYISQALLVSTRATCSRRSVGCIFVDMDGFVLSSGYNGTSSGEAHCIDSPCAGAGLPSGSGLNSCAATHAEVNALANCHDVSRVHSVYLTASPCVQCLRALKTTGARTIIYLNDYPGSELADGWRGIESKACQFEGGPLTDLVLNLLSELYEFKRF